MRRALLLPAALLVGCAAAVLVVSVTVTYGLAAEYGAGTPYRGGVGWVLLVLVPASIAVSCLVGARRLAETSRPATAVLAAAVLVLFATAGAAAAMYGGQAHERRTEATATAGA